MLRLVTYNIRHAVGSGWHPQKPDIARIAQVLCEVDADVVCLQEVLSVSGRTAEENQAAYLADACGYPCRAMGENHEWANGGFGNVTLSRVPFLAHTNHDLSVGSRVPRGCLQTDFDFHGRIVHLFNLHLGLDWRERGEQLARLTELARRSMYEPQDVSYANALTIFAGDFNEWIPFRLRRWCDEASTSPITSRSRSASASRRTKEVSRPNKNAEPKRLTGGCLRSFPTRFPILHFDGFFSAPASSRMTLHPSGASDHLPVIAEFQL